jgi:hypothetical protein
MSSQELLSQAINALEAWEESVRRLATSVEELASAITAMKSAEEDEARYRESRCMEEAPDTSSFSFSKKNLAFSPTVETRRLFSDATWNKSKAEKGVIEAKAVVTESMAKLRATVLQAEP